MASYDETLIYQATVDYKTAIDLGYSIKRSWTALRMHVFHVHQSASWVNVLIPIRNLAGVPTGEYRHFENFKEWFESVCEKSSLSDNYRSTLWTNTTILLPAVADGKVVTKEGEIISIDAVFKLPESQWQLLSGPTNILVEQINTGDTNASEKLAGVIQDAAIPGKRSFKKKLEDAGLSKTNKTMIDMYEVYLSSDQSAFLIVPKTEEEYRRFKMISAGHVDNHIVGSNDIVRITAEVVNSDASTEDVSEWLGTKA